MAKLIYPLEKLQNKIIPTIKLVKTYLSAKDILLPKEAQTDVLHRLKEINASFADVVAKAKTNNYFELHKSTFDEIIFKIESTIACIHLLIENEFSKSENGGAHLKNNVKMSQDFLFKLKAQLDQNAKTSFIGALDPKQKMTLTNLITEVTPLAEKLLAENLTGIITTLHSDNIVDYNHYFSKLGALKQKISLYEQTQPINEERRTVEEFVSELKQFEDDLNKFDNKAFSDQVDVVSDFTDKSAEFYFITEPCIVFTKRIKKFESSVLKATSDQNKSLNDFILSIEKQRQKFKIFGDYLNKIVLANGALSNLLGNLALTFGKIIALSNSNVPSKDFLIKSLQNTLSLTKRCKIFSNGRTKDFEIIEKSLNSWQLLGENCSRYVSLFIKEMNECSKNITAFQIRLTNNLNKVVTSNGDLNIKRVIMDCYSDPKELNLSAMGLGSVSRSFRALITSTKQLVKLDEAFLIQAKSGKGVLPKDMFVNLLNLKAYFQNKLPVSFNQFLDIKWFFHLFYKDSLKIELSYKNELNNMLKTAFERQKISTVEESNAVTINNKSKRKQLAKDVNVLGHKRAVTGNIKIVRAKKFNQHDFFAIENTKELKKALRGCQSEQANAVLDLISRPHSMYSYVGHLETERYRKETLPKFSDMKSAVLKSKDIHDFFTEYLDFLFLTKGYFTINGEPLYFDVEARKFQEKDDDKKYFYINKNYFENLKNIIVNVIKVLLGYEKPIFLKKMMQDDFIKVLTNEYALPKDECDKIKSTVKTLYIV